MISDDPLKPYEPPTQWTPDHVMVRMIWACEALDRLRLRAGPAGFGSGWPEYVYDQGDANARLTEIPGETPAERDSRLRDDKEQEFQQYRASPSAHELSMAEESLWWPVRYLKPDIEKVQGERKDLAVGLVVWAFRRSRGLSLAGWSMVAVHDEAQKIARGLNQDRVLVR